MLALLLLLLPLSAAISHFPIVSTSFGSIRGYEYTNEADFTAQIFKKLPFAAPPIGDLRWAKPQPPSKWNQTIDGTFFGPACAQRTLMYAGPVTGFSEDCLHVNVYTSQQCRDSSCPVLFLIHGGLGIYESTMKFPDSALVNNFVSQGIVVISTAYRVGVFGIMALGDEHALPANLAVHDVLAALEFTRAEIHAFGGDKERITIMGHSTGAQIALLFASSPGLSPPGVPRLFSSVISMSGPSGLETMEMQVERSHAVAKKINCTGTATEIVNCMRGFSTDEVLNAAFKVQGGNVFDETGLVGLVLGGELIPIASGKELFENTGEPLRLMIGTTLFEVIDLEEAAKLKPEGNMVNKVLGLDNDEECWQKYLDDKKTGKFETFYTTDSQAIILTAAITGKNQAEKGREVYLYEYDYPKHALHTDDAYFVLGFHEFKKDENEEWISRVYPRYFANFVNGGRPAPDWYGLKPNLMNYYSVYHNYTSGVSPHMKFGYQHNITEYYDDMMEYDRKLTTVKQAVLNAPVEYH